MRADPPPRTAEAPMTGFPLAAPTTGSGSHGPTYSSPRTPAARTTPTPIREPPTTPPPPAGARQGACPRAGRAPAPGGGRRPPRARAGRGGAPRGPRAPGGGGGAPPPGGRPPAPPPGPPPGRPPRQ